MSADTTKPLPIIPPTKAQALFNILPGPIYFPSEPQPTPGCRLVLLEVTLRVSPGARTLGPTYVSMIIPWPVSLEDSVSTFNNAVVWATRCALEQHCFWKPAPHAGQTKCLIQFALGWDNAWTNCPILGMMGNRVFLRPMHFMQYMDEFVVGQSPRVPVHVEVDAFFGQAIIKELEAQKALKDQQEAYFNPFRPVDHNFEQAPQQFEEQNDFGSFSDQQGSEQKTF